jgi:hypothetical protein
MKIIRATISDVKDENLKGLINSFQHHRCYPHRCFKKCKGGEKICKYGYPQALSDQDGLDQSGICFKYKRFTEEDKDVVP